MGRDLLIVSWSSPDGSEFDVGVLERSRDTGMYCFWYIESGVREAETKGFCLFPQFADRDGIHWSDRLFATFSSRLPSRARRDIDVILREYGLDEYDPFDLLAASGGRLPYDSLSFRRSN